MVSLARSSLIYEWKRYLAAVLAVAFAGLLTLVQIGILLGQFATATVVLDEATADLWVVAPSTQSFSLAREMPSSYEMRLRMHPQVETVQQMIFGFGDWRTPDGGKVSVEVMGLNISSNSLSFPKKMDASLRNRLREVGGLVIDSADVRKLKTTTEGTAEVNGKRVKVVGVTEGFRSIGGAYVFGSMSTVRDLMEGFVDSDYAQYFLIKLHDPDQAEVVRDALQPKNSNPLFNVVLPQSLSYQSQNFWLTESGAGASFGFSAFLALLVGIAITSQTLRAAILASIKEYAALRALGVSVKSLRAVVLEQAFWVGVAGLCITALFTWGLYVIAKANHVPITFPWWTLVGAALFMLFVALISGRFAIQPLYKTEPADLLR